jgi:hypothetical protein
MCKAKSAAGEQGAYADMKIMRTWRKDGPFYRAFELGKSA